MALKKSNRNTKRTTLRHLFALALVGATFNNAFIPTTSFAFPVDDLKEKMKYEVGTLRVIEDKNKYMEDDKCLQAWPVDCSPELGSGGSSTCGGWDIKENLAESESLPGLEGTCSTGTALALPDTLKTQGQMVGAMFPGKVLFAQSGKAPDGKDYGGVVVIQLKLEDGSPQCYVRYMFLDRRDMVRTGMDVKPGQRIGSVASDDMSVSKSWWTDNWGGPENARVKIDIGCDEALANLPHFMPKERYKGDGPKDNKSCPLTKTRFPAPILKYLASLEDGKNRKCHVGIRKPRPVPILTGFEKMTKIGNHLEYRTDVLDNSEKDTPLDANYIQGSKPLKRTAGTEANPDGIMLRKTTPVFALFGNEKTRNELYGYNIKRFDRKGAYRSHISYENATILMCKRMNTLFTGIKGVNLTPQEVREILTFCTNQYILGRATYDKVYEQQISEVPGMNSPLPRFLRKFLPEEIRDKYDVEVAKLPPENPEKSNKPSVEDYTKLVYDQIGIGYMLEAAWRDQCQPLHLEYDPQLNAPDYTSSNPLLLIQKSWKELLINWPVKNKIIPISMDQMKLNYDYYYVYPYERIHDPANPFSPRQIFKETERERYQNYNVQCAKTPVDMILGTYGKTIPDLKTYSDRDRRFHQCSSCRIAINEKKKACFADPYSFETSGGCEAGAGTNGVVAAGNNDILGVLMYEAYNNAGTASGETMYQELHQGAMLLNSNVGPINALIKERRGNQINAGVPDYKCAWVDTGGAAPTTNCPNNPRAGAKPQVALLTNMNNNKATFAVLADRGMVNGDADDFDFIKRVLGGLQPVYDGNDGATYTLYRAPVQGSDLPYAGEGTGKTLEQLGGNKGNIEGKGVGIKLMPPDWKCNPDMPVRGELSGVNYQITPLGDGSCGNKDMSAGATNAGSGGVIGGDIFGGGNGDAGGAKVGNFDPEGCSTTYAGSEYGFNGGTGKKCPPLSYPTPDDPGAGMFGCHARNFFAQGCDAACQLAYMSKCGALKAYWNRGGVNREKVCKNSSCPPVMHEGEDIGFEYGMPVYASAAGEVLKIAQPDGYLMSIDHSDYCIDPREAGEDGKSPTCKKYPKGMITKYLHMGIERILVKVGDKVKRCQQIGTVGDKRSAGVPHLHYETWQPENPMTGAVTAYWPLAQDVPYHTYLSDKSCTGGVWNAKGQGNGICKFKLPVNKEGEDDLPLPAYLVEQKDLEDAQKDYNEAKKGSVKMPDPPSPDRNLFDLYDSKEPGMVYEGGWKWCKNLDGDLKKLCLRLDKEDKDINKLALSTSTGTVSGNSIGDGKMINPLPCHEMTPSRRMGYVNPGGAFHHGQDIPAPEGTPILAAADGIVENMLPNRGVSYGNFTVLRHPNGIATRYAHQYAFCNNIKKGSNVVRGQVIGFVGNTGNSFGAHLHFEIKDDAADKNSIQGFSQPKDYVPEPNPGAPQCAAIKEAKCGDVITDLPTGKGVAGTASKVICAVHPCTTRYDEADTVAACAYTKQYGGCGPFGDYVQRSATTEEYGTISLGAREKDLLTYTDCCNFITRPVDPMNVLKVRPGHDKETVNPRWNRTNGEPQFIEGGWKGERTRINKNDMGKAGYGYGEGGDENAPVETENNPDIPEGYTFHEYYRNHRPYMRWWDTAGEAGQRYVGRVEADTDYGKYDALVGVGIEKNQCGYGGNGPNKLDGNTSWLELKLYQARSQYKNGMRCIARYENIFKAGSAEDYVLSQAGGTYKSHLTGSSRRSPLAVNWPLGWKGYASEDNPAYRFPRLLSYPYPDTASAKMIDGGLDNAMEGDILIWDADVLGTKSKLRHVAYVTGASTKASVRTGGFTPQQQRWILYEFERDSIATVEVRDFNYGKYPDVCGNTNWTGMAPPRKIYKAQLPASVAAEARAAGITKTECGDPDMFACVEPNWNTIKIYRPYENVRP